MQKLVQQLKKEDTQYMTILVGSHRDQISDEKPRLITYSEQSSISKQINGCWAEIGKNDQFNFNTLKVQIQAKCKQYFKQFKQQDKFNDIQKVSEDNIISNQLSIVLSKQEFEQQEQSNEQEQNAEETIQQSSEQQIQEINAQKNIYLKEIEAKTSMKNEETQYTPRSNQETKQQSFDDAKLSLINTNQTIQIDNQNQTQNIENSEQLTKDQLEQQEEIRQFNLKDLQDEMKIKIAKQSLNQEYKPKSSRLGVHYLNKEFTPAIVKTHEPVVRDEELMRRIQNYKMMSSRKFLQQQRQQEENLKATVQKVVIQDNKFQEVLQNTQKQNEIQQVTQKYDAIITIEYNNKQYDLQIKKSDDPIQRAKQFCNAMSIPESKINKIAVSISQQIQNIIRQEQQQKELTQQDLLQNNQQTVQKIDAIFQITVDDNQYDLPYVIGQKADVLAHNLCQLYNLDYNTNKHLILQQIQEMIKMINQNQ